jgi:hypothetical protein
VIIFRKKKLKGLAQWIRNKSEGDPNFIIGAAKASDIELILSTAASGKNSTYTGRDGVKPIPPKPWDGKMKTWINTRQLVESRTTRKTHQSGRGTSDH